MLAATEDSRRLLDTLMFMVVLVIVMAVFGYADSGAALHGAGVDSMMRGPVPRLAMLGL